MVWEWTLCLRSQSGSGNSLLRVQASTQLVKSSMEIWVTLEVMSAPLHQSWTTHFTTGSVTRYSTTKTWPTWECTTPNGLNTLTWDSFTIWPTLSTTMIMQDGWVGEETGKIKRRYSKLDTSWLWLPSEFLLSIMVRNNTLLVATIRTTDRSSGATLTGDCFHNLEAQICTSSSRQSLKLVRNTKSGTTTRWRGMLTPKCLPILVVNSWWLLLTNCHTQCLRP